MNQDMRVVRGLSIATIVLSALGILGGLAMALFMGIASASLNDPTVVNALVDELRSSGSSSAFDGSSPYSAYDFSGMTESEAMAAASASIMLMIGLSFGYVIAKVVCLIAGIFALRSCSNPAKLGGAFGLGIAAAILSVFMGGMVSLVLFVIMTVFVSRARKAYAAMAGTPYGYQPQAPMQNMQPQSPQLQQPRASQQPGQSIPPASQQPEKKGNDADSGDAK